MTPQDRPVDQPARKPRLTRDTIAIAIPAIAAVVLGAILVLPTVFASATSQTASVWAGPVIARPAATVSETPTAQAPIPSVQPAAPAPSKTVATTPVTTKPAKATTTTAKKATTAAPAKTTAAKTATTIAPAGPFVITVNGVGGQPEIDACKGPILWNSTFIVQHASCGGTRYYPLTVGSLVTLAGSAVTPGIYRVTSIAETFTGNTKYAIPHPYAIQTCLTDTDTRLWYLQPV